MMEKEAEGEALLGGDALKGLRLGISVSESPDLQRLGLLETHLRLAVGELARVVLVSRGQLNYGGHLDPEGYTAFLAHELHRFSRRDRPFHSILAWSEHRRLSVERLQAQITELGLYGDLTGLDPDGREIDVFADRPAEAVSETDEGVVRKSLTSLRQYLTDKSDGRILIGGKRSGFQGELPGMIEEALLALEADQPIYLAGGFGGVTADIARVLEVDGGEWIPQDPDESDQDERWRAGLDSLANLWREKGRDTLDNGLTEAENRVLAVSHRPSEIAALVSLGLGRKFAAKGHAEASTRGRSA